MVRHVVESEVAGNVWKIEVKPGDRVASGDVLIILESMKMEIPIESPRAGIVAELRVAAQQTVAEGQVVAVIDGTTVWDEKVNVETGKDTNLVLSQATSPVPAEKFTLPAEKKEGAAAPTAAAR